MHYFVCFSGDYVAHIKFTVLLMPNGSDRVTSHPLQELQPTKSIDDPDIKAWLALGTKTKKKGGGKKKKGMLLFYYTYLWFCFASCFYVIEQNLYLYKDSIFLVLNGSTIESAWLFAQVRKGTR